MQKHFVRKKLLMSLIKNDRINTNEMKDLLNLLKSKFAIGNLMNGLMPL